jgi:NNP family nitrate/nitrite transporter-like MFS transporter
LCLGMGNGSVFQLVPQRFGREIGAVTGIVGAAGGLGGFLLPSFLGIFKDLTGTYGSGFFLLAGMACYAFWRCGASRIAGAPGGCMVMTP